LGEPKINERKMVRRSVAIALGIICIILIAFISYFSITSISAQNNYNNLQNQNKQLQTWLDGNKTLLNQTQTWLGDNVTTYNSQINSLNSQIANLQNILNGLTNGTGIPLDIIVNNSSAWVNKTVLVQGTLTAINLIVLGGAPPWDYLLTSNNGINQIGVYWWKDDGLPWVSQVQIYGVVRQGIWTNQFSGNTTVFYIEAEIIDPI
jgi:uncharacterized protein YukE